MRPASALVLLLLVACLLSGCSRPVVCPAIGWLNVIHVELYGDVAPVTGLELCAAGRCAAREHPSDSWAPDSGTAAGAAPFSVSRETLDRWRIDLDASAPERVTVRAFDEDGARLAERTLDVDWKRVGGTEQCGGPQEATLRLEIR